MEKATENFLFRVSLRTVRRRKQVRTSNTQQQVCPKVVRKP